jgi:molybdate transport system regulatory protein
MDPNVKLKSVPHLSLQSNRKTVLDELDAMLLWKISETNSLTEAAGRLGISYRNAWGRIRRIESDIGTRILETKAGGAAGGSSRLTPQGVSLLKGFRSTRSYLFNALEDREGAENVYYKLSVRNRIGARILGIERGDVTSLIKMAATVPITLTSIISNEAVEDLELHQGDEVVAIVKSTEVMVAKPFPSSRRRKTEASGQPRPPSSRRPGR